jgi:hypothetical protein
LKTNRRSSLEVNLVWFQRFASVTRRSYSFKSLSPDDFERLIYWLASRSGEFDAVHWYRGARASRKGRDVVAIKSVDTGRERWYIQCKRQGRINYALLRRELDSLASLADKMPNFTPQVIVFTTAGDVPSVVKNRSTIYARALGLPEPRYWSRRKLSEMLEAQPQTREEFFGRQAPLLRRIGSQLTRPAGVWSGVALLCLLSFVVVRTVSSRLSLPPVSQEPTAGPTAVAVMVPAPTMTAPPTPAALPTSTSTPTRTPQPSPTDTPRPTPTGTSAPTRTPTSTPGATATATAIPTPIPTPTFVLDQPIPVQPVMGAVERAAIFRWQGRLGPGQYFVVRLWYLGADWARESGPLQTNCWEADLPAEWYGGWRWQVRVFEGTTLLAESEERDFWFDPFPRPETPYPPIRPCGE